MLEVDIICRTYQTCKNKARGYKNEQFFFVEFWFCAFSEKTKSCLTLKIIPSNTVKHFSDKILKLNNLNIVDLDHNQLEFLQLKGLLNEELIKPLYLS